MMEEFTFQGTTADGAQITITVEADSFASAQEEFNMWQARENAARTQRSAPQQGLPVQTVRDAEAAGAGRGFMGRARDAMSLFADGVGFGLTNEMDGLVHGAAAAARGGDFGEAYSQASERTRQNLAEARQALPGFSEAGAIAQGLATLPARAASAAASPASTSFAGRMRDSAAVGAGFGGANAAGHADGDLDQRATALVEGALVGGATGALAQFILDGAWAAGRNPTQQQRILHRAQQLLRERLDDAGVTPEIMLQRNTRGVQTNLEGVLQSDGSPAAGHTAMAVARLGDPNQGSLATQADIMWPPRPVREPQETDRVWDARLGEWRASRYAQGEENAAASRASAVDDPVTGRETRREVSRVRGQFTEALRSAAERMTGRPMRAVSADAQAAIQEAETAVQPLYETAFTAGRAGRGLDPQDPRTVQQMLFWQSNPEIARRLERARQNLASETISGGGGDVAARYPGADAPIPVTHNGGQQQIYSLQVYDQVRRMLDDEIADLITREGTRNDVRRLTQLRNDLQRSLIDANQRAAGTARSPYRDAVDEYAGAAQIRMAYDIGYAITQPGAGRLTPAQARQAVETLTETGRQYAQAAAMLGLDDLAGSSARVGTVASPLQQPDRREALASLFMPGGAPARGSAGAQSRNAARAPRVSRDVEMFFQDIDDVFAIARNTNIRDPGTNSQTAPTQAALERAQRWRQNPLKALVDEVSDRALGQVEVGANRQVERVMRTPVQQIRPDSTARQVSRPDAPRPPEFAREPALDYWQQLIAANQQRNARRPVLSTGGAAGAVGAGAAGGQSRGRTNAPAATPPPNLELLNGQLPWWLQPQAP